MNDEILVEALNTLIEEAVCDGGDAGGAYNQNEQKLVKSMDAVLNVLGLQDKYEVAKHEWRGEHWSLYYIGRKEKKEEETCLNFYNDWTEIGW